MAIVIDVIYGERRKNGARSKVKGIRRKM